MSECARFYVNEVLVCSNMVLIGFDIVRIYYVWL